MGKFARRFQAEPITASSSSTSDELSSRDAAAAAKEQKDQSDMMDQLLDVGGELKAVDQKMVARADRSSKKKKGRK